MNPDSKDRYLDLKGASAYASLGVSTIRGYIKGQGLPAYRLSGKVLIRKSEFDEWMQQWRLSKTQDIGAIVDSVIKGIKG